MPEAVGVPLNTPAELKERPGTPCPDVPSCKIDHVNGDCPVPVTRLKVYEYAEPTVAAGNVPGLLITGGGEFTCIDSNFAAEVCPAVSFTVTSN